MTRRKLLGLWAAVILLAGLAVWCTPSCDRAMEPVVDPVWSRLDTLHPDLRCDASYYSHPEHGRPTASGELFDSTMLTCAIYNGFRKYAPYGSTLLVRNPMNGQRVLVRVNDVMPDSVLVLGRGGKRRMIHYAKEGRMLDLSRAAAESLSIVWQGVAPVEAWRVK